MKVSLEKKLHAVRIIRQGAPVRVVAEELGVTTQAIYKWLQKYKEVPIMAEQKIEAIELPQSFFGKLWQFLGL